MGPHSVDFWSTGGLMKKTRFTTEPIIAILQELATEGVIGGLTDNFYTFIGYNMDPERLERTLAEDIAAAVSDEGADIALAAPA